MQEYTCMNNSLEILYTKHILVMMQNHSLNKVFTSNLMPRYSQAATI